MSDDMYNLARQGRGEPQKFDLGPFIEGLTDSSAKSSLGFYGTPPSTTVGEKKPSIRTRKADKRAYFESLVRSWAEVLGVGHYEIDLVWVPKLEHDGHEYWAEVTAKDNSYYAYITVGDDGLKRSVEEQSETAAHEVLHIVMASADNFMHRFMEAVGEDKESVGMVSMFNSEWAILNEKRVDRLATSLNKVLLDVILDMTSDVTKG